MNISDYQKQRNYFRQDHTQKTLTELQQDYIALTRSLHYKHEALQSNLRCFTDFLHSLNINQPQQINSDLALDYQQFLSQRYRPSTSNRRIADAKRFCQHLLRLDLLNTNPFQDTPTLRQPPFIPYIFNTDELSRIFNHKLSTPTDDYRRFTHFSHYCAYHTIYACGLRVSELSNLDIEHVDLSQCTLTIRRTKFDKDRIVPFNAKVRQNLQAYLTLRDRHFAETNTLAFFLNQDGNRFRRGALSSDFRIDLRKLGIYRKDKLVDGILYGAPRIHSLRHSFAVQRLLRWYREGADCNQKLPLLATYMGHLKFEHTLVYLNICAATLREANARFAEKFEDLFALWRTETTLDSKGACLREMETR